jgi:hypothetical protein
MNVSISFRPKLVDGCSRLLPKPDKIDIVGAVKRSASDQHHPTPKPEVPAVGAPITESARTKISKEHADAAIGVPGKPTEAD